MVSIISSLWGLVLWSRPGHIATRSGWCWPWCLGSGISMWPVLSSTCSGTWDKSEEMSLFPAWWHSWLEGKLVMMGTLLSTLGWGVVGCGRAGCLRVRQSRAQQICGMEKDEHFFELWDLVGTEASIYPWNSQYQDSISSHLLHAL